MASSMKYLGAATEDGEWWCDRASKSDAMGSGVSFWMRLGEDGGNGPHVTIVSGYREDVIFSEVEKEMARMVEDYLAQGRTLQGPMRPISIERWKTAGERLAELRKTNNDDAVRAAFPRGWVQHWVLRGRWEAIAQCKYLGREEIVAAMIPPEEVRALWPYVAIGHGGKPWAFRRCTEIEADTCMGREVAYVREAKPEDWVVA